MNWVRVFRNHIGVVSQLYTFGECESTGFQEPQNSRFRVFRNPGWFKRVFRNQARVFRNEFRVIGNHPRVFRNKKAGYQERKVSGFQEPAFRVFRNLPPSKPLNSLTKFDTKLTVTRARDLNPIFNLLTPNPRLLGGFAPCRLKPTHPAHPHKDRPPGEPQNQKIPRRRLRRRENEPDNTDQAR